MSPNYFSKKQLFEPNMSLNKASGQDLRVPWQRGPKSDLACKERRAKEVTVRLGTLPKWSRGVQK